MAQSLKTGSLDERDFDAWMRAQAGKRPAQAHKGIDREGAAEAIEGLCDATFNEIESRHAALIAPLLKGLFQPDRRSHRRKAATILVQRTPIARGLRQSPSRKRCPQEACLDEDPLVRIGAPGEMDVREGDLPAECPFAIEDKLDLQFRPEAARP